MTRWTLAWALWLLAFLVIEVAAWRTGNYWNTLSGSAVKLMLAHPAAAVVVVGALFAVLAHLALDYTYFRLR